MALSRKKATTIALDPEADHRYPTERGRYGVGDIPFDNGFRDGYDKGREDARDNDSYDPVRYSSY
jgi:hypothetical protein